MWTGKCSLVKGVSKQPLLLSSMLSREKQATPRFLPAGLPFSICYFWALDGIMVHDGIVGNGDDILLMRSVVIKQFSEKKNLPLNYVSGFVSL